MNRIQTLWIGPRLSTLGRLTIESFLAHGHSVDLYGYQPIANTPAGATLRDAREIYPQTDVFVYRRGAGKGSPSAFSNLFRYRLLELKGGWWSDLDVVCLQPLDFPDEHVFGLEHMPDEASNVASSLMKAPPGSPIMRYCRETAEAADRKNVRWGQIGPQLVTMAVELIGPTLATEPLLLPPEYLSPLVYWQIERLVESSVVPQGAYAVHLYHEMWRREGLDPDREYAPDSLYEQLVRRYLGDIERKNIRSTWWDRWWPVLKVS